MSFSVVSAALPYRIGVGGFQVLLIRSSAGRWLIPKGHLEHGESPIQAAAREAWEEAGVRGEISDAPCGTFDHRGIEKAQRVVVYPLLVQTSDSWWPEKDRRQQMWCWAGSLPNDIVPLLAGIITAFAAATQAIRLGN